MTTPTQVKQHFIVSGSPITTILEYEKFKTTTLPQVEMEVTNSSQQFAIQFYPTGSSRLIYTTTEQPPANITRTLPYTLPTSSLGKTSGVKLLVTINTDGLNDMTDNTQEDCVVKFAMVAITSSTQTINIPPADSTQRLPSWTPPTTSPNSPLPTSPTGTTSGTAPGTDEICGCVSGRCTSACTNNGDFCEDDSWCSDS